MVQLSLVEIVTVTRDQDNPRMTLSSSRSGSRHGNDAGPPNMSLASIKESAPDLLIPSYLPDGFSLTWASMATPARIMLSYRKRIGETMSADVDILEEEREGSVKVKDGFLHKVTVGEHEGYYLDGGWVIPHDHHAGPQRIAYWDVGHTASLIFERDSRWIMLHIAHPGELPQGVQDDLVRIGSSMQPY